MSAVRQIQLESLLITQMSKWPVSYNYWKLIFNKCLVPPLVQVSKNKEMIGRGEQIVLDCRVIKGTPKPQFKWFKGDYELRPYSGLIIQDGRLTIQANIQLNFK
jgi:hypothetical protein